MGLYSLVKVYAALGAFKKIHVLEMPISRFCGYGVLKICAGSFFRQVCVAESWALCDYGCTYKDCGWLEVSIKTNSPTDKMLDFSWNIRELINE